MKRKIICLAICIACLITMLVSCGSGDPVTCDAHADLDKNSACDTCGIPMIVITEQVPTEQVAVEMVVNAIPADATLGDVFVIKGEEKELLPVFKKNEDLDAASGELLGKYVFFNYLEQTAGEETEEDISDDKFVRTYVLYDLFAEKATVTIECDEYSYDEYPYYDEVRADTVTADGEVVFIVLEHQNWYVDEYGNPGYVEESTYYDISGKKFASSKDVEEGYWFEEPYVMECKDDLVYVNHDDKVYVLDLYTAAVVYSCDANLFVDRPEFDEVIGNYGYVERGNSVYVYDLTKWLECVFSYEVSYSASVFYMSNGNLLVQESVALPDSDINYDYAAGTKYDIVYTIVDVAAKTATEVEFGYYIEDVEIVAEDEEVKDGVKLCVEAYVIENKVITDKYVELYTDDSLKILGEFYSMLPDFVEDIEPLADGVLLGTVVYGEGSSVRKLFDATGKEIATLPNNAIVRDGYIEISGKFYNAKMQLIFDPNADAENPFEAYFHGDGYKIFKQGVDFFYWNPTLTAPVCIIDNPEPVVDPEGELVPVSEASVEKSILLYGAEHFVIKIETTTEVPAEVEGGEPTEVVVTTYKVYNANNVEILSTESEFDFQFRDMLEIEFNGETRYIITTEDNSVYIAK